MQRRGGSTVSRVAERVIPRGRREGCPQPDRAGSASHQVIGVQPFYQLVATGTILGVSLDQFRSHRQETR